MLIDSSPILSGDQGLRTGQSTPFSTELSKLILDLKLIPAQKLTAIVSKITLLTQEERSLLSELKTNQVSAPEIKRNWSEILNNPNLKHVQLTVNTRLINTLTTTNILKGQEIEFTITPNGLKLSDDGKDKPSSELIFKTPSKPITKPTTNPISNADTMPKTTYNLSKTFELPNPLSPKVFEDLMKQAISKALPDSKPHDQVFQTFHKLIKQINRAPQDQIPRQIKQLAQGLNIALKKNSLTVQPSTTPSPNQVKQAIMSSGTFYEQLTLGKAQTQASALSSVKANDASASTKNTPSQEYKPPPSQPKEVSRRLVEEDLKGSLLQLATWIQKTTPLTPQANPIQKNDDVLTKLLLNLLQSINHKQAVNNQKPDTKIIFQNIQKLIEQSIARIQLQQYKTLNSQSQDPSTTSSNIFHVDIPIRTPDTYSNIYLQLFEPKLKDEKTDKKNGNQEKKKAKWRIFMELELDDDGCFAVEINVSGKKMDATFWAENDALRQKAEKNILKLREDLEQRGLEVTDLRCSKNNPPKQKIQMNFALIDVKT